jgi:MFS transporter, ACS family, tartrate transporter
LRLEQGSAVAVARSEGPGAGARDQSASDARRKLEAAVVRKIAWRIVPLLGVAYLIAYLDRSNIGIASLTMLPSLHMNTAQFGLAAGLFFIGYVAGELPSNLLQVRYGARRWLARIMITWGVVAMATAFVANPPSLYLSRIVLGVAEAGFTPGAVLYLAFWFPERFRSRIFALFLVAIPASVVVGAPTSAALLYLNGVARLAGWQWLFLLEGLPAVLVGLLFLKLLPNGPAEASWLSDSERLVLAEMMGPDNLVAAHARAPIRKALLHPKMWQMALFGSGISAGSYGIIFFLPQIIAEFGTTYIETGLLTALPFLASAIAMVAWGWHADRVGERRWHAVLPLLLASVSFLLAAVAIGPVAKMIALIVAAMGLYMSAGLLWSFTPLFFRRGAEAAAAVAIINMIGMIAGFVQPTIIGHLRQTSGAYSGGLLATAAPVLIGAVAGLALLSGRAAKFKGDATRD